MGGHSPKSMRCEPPRNADPWFSSAVQTTGGVIEKLGIGNWAIDRDEFSFNPRLVYTCIYLNRTALAESWSHDPTPQLIVINIRQGVHWHNKAPMNSRELDAYDVEWNFHRFTGLGSGFTEPSPYVKNARHQSAIPGIDNGHRQMDGRF